MRRLLVIICLLTVVLAVPLSGLVIARRQANELHLQTLRNTFVLGTCAQPCWRGILFGKTTPEEIGGILSTPPTIAALDLGGSDCVHWTISVESSAWKGSTCQTKGQPINEIGLYNPAGGGTFRVIDAIWLFGNPQNVSCRVFQFAQTQRTFPVWLFFDHGIIVSAEQVLSYDRFIVDPEMVVNYIDYRPLARPSTDCMCAWRGFNYTRRDLDTMNAISTCPVLK